MTILLAALALAANLATHDADWSRVRHLKSGSEVFVTASIPPDSETTFEFASFIRADENALFIRVRSAVRRISRDDVRDVVVRRVKTRGSPEEVVRGFLIGALLGIVGAAGGGTGPNFCTEHPNGCVPAGVGIGGALGGAGAYFGGHGEKTIEDVVVYHAARVY